ncbi:SPOR domain-containing protein [Streptomyces sp. NPDC088197]|uniref:SPOR domain-containing protein n=1 Tax=unclassified Streptomyces TaxID=2593676 RepID=UPI0033B6EB99
MTTDLVWLLIRQDESGNRYRVGRYATRAEAERVAATLNGPGLNRDQQQRRYVIERLTPRAVQSS